MPKVEFKYDISKDKQNVLKVLTQPSNFAASGEYALRGMDKKLIDKVRSEKDNAKKEKIITDYLQNFLNENKKLIDEKIEFFSRDWDKINDLYFKRLSKILDIEILKDKIFTAYLTNARGCPFNPWDNWFMVPFVEEKVDTVATHEIMHIEFYNNYFKYCEDAGLNQMKIRDLWESLTILLNEEMSDILSHPDFGYIEHKELRKQISEIWKQNKDFKNLIDKMTEIMLKK